MANETAKVQAIVNGQTVTLAEVALINAGTQVTAETAQSVSLALPYPVKVDAGTTLRLVVVLTGSTSITSAAVHTISRGF